jgi:hypothetical protein
MKNIFLFCVWVFLIILPQLIITYLNIKVGARLDLFWDRLTSFISVVGSLSFIFIFISLQKIERNWKTWCMFVTVIFVLGFLSLVYVLREAANQAMNSFF